MNIGPASVPVVKPISIGRLQINLAPLLQHSINGQVTAFAAPLFVIGTFVMLVGLVMVFARGRSIGGKILLSVAAIVVIAVAASSLYYLGNIGKLTFGSAADLTCSSGGFGCAMERALAIPTVVSDTQAALAPSPDDQKSTCSSLLCDLKDFLGQAASQTVAALKGAVRDALTQNYSAKLGPGLPVLLAAALFLLLAVAIPSGMHTVGGEAGAAATPPIHADSQTSLPAAGWYADPSGQFPRRWWDGEKWTASVWHDSGDSPPF